MAWIELHQAVWTHRKTFELAGILDLDDTYAAAHLIRLWTWALDNAPSGDLNGISDRAVAYGAGWRGDAEAFVSALVDSGWLDADRCIHDWNEYAGRLIERRTANADRMRAARATRVLPTNRGHSESVQSTCSARAGATVPDSTVPDSTGNTPVVPSFPEAGADAPPTAAAALTGQANVLRGLSDEARELLDWHRECHGARRVAKLNPTSAQALEDAIADLGLALCRESVKFMAAKIPPVTELSKALAAARSKRLMDANGASRNGAAPRPVNAHPSRLMGKPASVRIYHVGGKTNVDA